MHILTWQRLMAVCTKHLCFVVYLNYTQHPCLDPRLNKQIYPGFPIFSQEFKVVEWLISGLILVTMLHYLYFNLNYLSFQKDLNTHERATYRFAGLLGKLWPSFCKSLTFDQHNNVTTTILYCWFAVRKMGLKPYLSCFLMFNLYFLSPFWCFHKTFDKSG